MGTFIFGRHFPLPSKWHLHSSLHTCEPVALYDRASEKPSESFDVSDRSCWAHGLCFGIHFPTPFKIALDFYQRVYRKCLAGALTYQMGAAGQQEEASSHPRALRAFPNS